MPDDSEQSEGGTAAAGSSPAERDPASAEVPSTTDVIDPSEHPSERAADAERETRPERKGTRQRPRDPALARAFRSGRSVEGKITAVIKGGYEVRVGRSRAFCPHSQIDIHRVDTPEEMIGKRLLFRVSQFRRGGDDVVISRRAVLEEERAEEAKAVRATLLEGAVLQGKVAGTADFGAFVDLGAGVMGLVHVSELSHSRVGTVRDVVKVGDPITVRILKMDEKGQRISLSARQAQEDPWASAAEGFVAGRVVRGKVLRLTDFGAFVQLAQGIEALAPAREFPPRKGGWREGLEPGTEADWLILSADVRNRRISVTPAPEDAATASGSIEPGATLRGKVQKVQSYGVFVWLGPGKVGLMPNVWSGEPRGANLDQRFPVADDVEVEVVEVGDGGRRIRLARKGHAPAKTEPKRAKGDGKPAGRAAQRAEPQASTATFGTTLADKLKAALEATER